MYRFTIKNNENYVVELEYVSGNLFLHCDVKKFNKSTLRSMIRDWLDMEEALSQEGFERVFAVPKDKKGFIKHTGWDFYGYVDEDDKELEVYVWELKQP